MGANIEANQLAELPNGMRLHYASAGEKGRLRISATTSS